MYFLQNTSDTYNSFTKLLCYSILVFSSYVLSFQQSSFTKSLHRFGYSLQGSTIKSPWVTLPFNTFTNSDNKVKILFKILCVCIYIYIVLDTLLNYILRMIQWKPRICLFLLDWKLVGVISMFPHELNSKNLHIINFPNTPFNSKVWRSRF